MHLEQFAVVVTRKARAIARSLWPRPRAAAGRDLSVNPPRARTGAVTDPSHTPACESARYEPRAGISGWRLSRDSFPGLEGPCEDRSRSLEPYTSRPPTP